MVKEGAFFLVAALTSLVAYQKAEKLLFEECVNLHARACESNVLVQIDECTVLDGKKIQLGGRDLRKYWCVGNCIPKSFKNSRSKEEAINFGCENLRTGGELVLDFTDRLPTSFNTLARSYFQSNYLTQYCKENSQGNYFWENKSQSLPGRTVKVNLCVAASADYYVNPSIRCNQIEPPYKKPGPKKKN